MPVTAVMFKGCCLWDPCSDVELLRPVWTGQAVIHIKSRKKYNLLTSSFKMQKVASALLLPWEEDAPLGQCHELFFRFMLKTLLKFRPKKYTECRKKGIHTKLVKETEDLIWIRTFIMVVTTAKVLVGNILEFTLAFISSLFKYSPRVSTGNLDKSCLQVWIFNFFSMIDYQSKNRLDNKSSMLSKRTILSGENRKLILDSFWHKR